MAGIPAGHAYTHTPHTHTHTCKHALLVHHPLHVSWLTLAPPGRRNGGQTRKKSRITRGRTRRRTTHPKISQLAEWENRIVPCVHTVDASVCVVALGVARESTGTVAAGETTARGVRGMLSPLPRALGSIMCSGLVSGRVATDEASDRGQPIQPTTTGPRSGPCSTAQERKFLTKRRDGATDMILPPHARRHPSVPFFPFLYPAREEGGGDGGRRWEKVCYGSAASNFTPHLQLAHPSPRQERPDSICQKSPSVRNFHLGSPFPHALEFHRSHGFAV